eukprot:scaffold29339_cov37-Tisochrysis_lutea.AAC.1
MTVSSLCALRRRVPRRRRWRGGEAPVLPYTPQPQRSETCADADRPMNGPVPTSPRAMPRCHTTAHR